MAEVAIRPKTTARLGRQRVMGALNDECERMISVLTNQCRRIKAERDSSETDRDQRALDATEQGKDLSMKRKDLSAAEAFRDWLRGFQEKPLQGSDEGSILLLSNVDGQETEIWVICNSNELTTVCNDERIAEDFGVDRFWIMSTLCPIYQRFLADKIIRVGTIISVDVSGNSTDACEVVDIF